MILLLGQRNDPPIDLVSQALSDQGCDFRLLDGRHFAEAKLNIDFSNKKLSGRLLLEDEVIPLEDPYSPNSPRLALQQQSALQSFSGTSSTGLTSQTQLS
jgi:hypothetical protein